MGNPGRGKGKRGGFRYLYLYLERSQHIHLLILLDKNEQEDADDGQRAQMRDWVSRIKKTQEREHGKEEESEYFQRHERGAL